MNEETKLTKAEIEKLRWRGRGLDRFAVKVGDLDKIILEHSNGEIKVLEVGTGFGQVLIELAAKYGTRLKLYGINKEPGSIDIVKAIRVALHKGTIDAQFKLADGQLTFAFSDAGVTIPFEKEYFDIVISQVCIAYIEDKINLLREVAKVLAPEGIALLHVEFEYTGPSGNDEATMEIWENGKKKSIVDYFNSFPNIRYIKRHTGSVIIMRGGTTPDFKLNLLRTEPLPDNEMHGIMSVYEMEQSNKI